MHIFNVKTANIKIANPSTLCSFIKLTYITSKYLDKFNNNNA